MAKGSLFIVSAPSGAGKTTLIRGLMNGRMASIGGLEFSVSHTTRRARDGEVDGRDYYFVDPASFHSMIAADEFLEWAEVHGHYYGTSKDEVFPRLEAGIDVVLDIDVQGAERVLATQIEAHTVFIMPPSFQDLEIRLRQRGLDGPGEIARRLAVSLWEIRRYGLYQYVIVNDDAERATEALAAIILDKRQRRERMGDRVEKILSDFQRGSE
jgi:guanylate kinase